MKYALQRLNSGSDRRPESLEKKQIMRCTTIFIASFIILLSIVTPDHIQATEQTSEPIQIEADSMESSQKESEVRFFGNVVARQADIVIYADNMTVNYEGGTKDGDNFNVKQNVKKLQASGHTKIVKDTWISTGDEMIFYADERKVLLTGNAKAWQDKNMVSGDRIILFLDEGKSVIDGGNKNNERVKAFIYPEAESAEKK